MSLLFDWYETPDSHDKPREEKLLYPRVCLHHRCTTDSLCEQIEKMTTAHRADIKLVLSALSDIVGRRLRDGYYVHLEGLGYFNVTLAATEPVHYSTKNKTLKVKVGGIKFLPEKELKKVIELTHAEPLRAMQSKKLTSEEMDAQLTAHFAQQPYMTRSEFESLCNLTRTTANRYLRQLIDDGYLLRKGSTYHPVYVPAPGHYGAPAAEVPEPATKQET